MANQQPPDQIWGMMNQALEETLAEMAGQRNIHQNQSGRGAPITFITKQQRPNQVHSEYGSCLEEIVPQWRTIRRLKKILHQWKDHGWTQQTHNTFYRINKDLTKFWPEITLTQKTTTQQIQQIIQEYTEYLDTQHNKAMLQRIPAWVRSMQESWKGNRKQVWTYMKSRTRPRKTCNTMITDNKEWTSNPKVILKLIKKYWLTIFCPNEETPSWENYKNKYAKHIKHHPWPHNPITREEWIHTCRHISPTTAGGADGWTADDILALPDEALTAAFETITYMQHNNYTPEVWGTLLGATIPKDDYDGQPKDLRIITLLSLWYRVWSKLQYQRAMMWLDQWAPPEIVGGRPGGDPSTIYYPRAIQLEQAHYDKTGKPFTPTCQFFSTHYHDGPLHSSRKWACQKT